MTQWYARFGSDVKFRRAVTAAYDGPHEVGDALWWLDHPDDDAPSGAPTPRRGLAEVQRAAFSRPEESSSAGRDSAADEPLSAQREFAALTQSLEADRSAAQAAVDRALGVADAHEPAVRHPLLRRVLGAMVVAPDARGNAGAGAGAGAAASVRGAARVRLTRVGVLVAAGVLAVMVAGGVVVSSGAFVRLSGGGPGAHGNSAASGTDTTGEPSGGVGNDGLGAGDPGGGSSYSATEGAFVPDPDQTAPPFPNFPPGTGENSYNLVFSRPQLVSDLPPDPPPPDLQVVTFRSLSAGQYTRGKAFAAVSTTDQVCLVVYGNGTDYGLTCADVDVVAVRGLQVSLITTDSKDPVTGAHVEALGVSARWEADGTFALDASTPYDRD